MDTLGPRIMVNVGTQAVSNTGLNPRDLAPLTNDAFLATFTGKAPLPASNGISRPHNNNNNYRQSYTTQMERLTLRSKQRPSAPVGESIEPDSAILSIIRGNGSESNQQHLSQRQPSGTRNRRRSLNQQLLGGWNDLPCSPNYRPTNEGNRRRRTRSGGAQQQISVVDQMAAQPHIPYAILPKRFEPKQVAGNGLQQQSRSSNNNNNNNLNGGNRRRRPAAPRRSQRQQEFYDDQWEDDEDDDLWLEPMPPMMMMNRRFARRPNRSFNPPPAYYGPRRLDNYYDSYAYGPMPRQGPMPLRPRRRMTYPDEGYVPFDIVPSYDLNEWQGPYARPRQSMYSQQRNGGRFGNGFIHDDHRMNGSSRQSRNGNKPSTPTRNGKQAKSPKNGKGQQKRRTSRQRKQRNQNSKTEGTPLTSTNDNELTTDEKLKHETTDTDAKPLPPRDHENKENNGEVKSE